MNRPSLAAAFGDKEALYLTTLERYRDDAVVALKATLSGAKPLRKELAEARLERDILKKATAYFARESLPGTRS